MAITPIFSCGREILAWQNLRFTSIYDLGDAQVAKQVGVNFQWNDEVQELSKYSRTVHRSATYLMYLARIQEFVTFCPTLLEHFQPEFEPSLPPTLLCSAAEKFTIHSTPYCHHAVRCYTDIRDHTSTSNAWVPVKSDCSSVMKCSILHRLSTEDLASPQAWTSLLQVPLHSAGEKRGRQCQGC